MLPISPQEIAECAEAVLEAGASILHLHVRDPVGGHTLDVGAYRRAISAVRERVGDRLIIQATTEAQGLYAPDQQMDMVRALKPEAVSLALREIVPGGELSMKVRELFRWMRGEGIFPHIILYDARDLKILEQYAEARLFGDNLPFLLFVAGRYVDETNAKHNPFAYFTSRVDSLKFPWAVCSFGAEEHKAADFAARNGGHIRVGFENNLWRPDGNLAHDNAELVAFARSKAEKAGRGIMLAADVRRMINGSGYFEGSPSGAENARAEAV